VTVPTTPQTPDDGDAPSSAPIRVALYITDASGNQEQFLRRYAEEHLPDSAVVATYRDNGYPGRTQPTLRPGLRDVLTAATSGLFDVLLTERLTRISRRVDYVVDVAGQLQAASIRLITADQEIDTGTPLGHTVMAMAGVLAKAQREHDRAHRQATRSGAAHNP
jgi:DNA invertase Pin-like site-specific DNA recombinase